MNLFYDLFYAQFPLIAPVVVVALAVDMKIYHKLLLVIALSTTVWAGDTMLPPENLRGKWAELEERKFAAWSIKAFHGWTIPFDGGSKVFALESDSGERFDVVVANPAYWTETDKKDRRQVFLIIHKNRYYRIEPKSKEEENMILKLTVASHLLSGEGNTDPKLLKKLAENLESRKSIFKQED